jgi:cobalt-zinc-cadmium efflux system protein
VWSLAGGTPLLTAHLVVDHSVTAIEVLRQAGRTLRERFGVTHATLQVEPPDYNIVDGLTPAASDGRNDGEDRG